MNESIFYTIYQFNNQRVLYGFFSLSVKQLFVSHGLVGSIMVEPNDEFLNY